MSYPEGWNITPLRTCIRELRAGVSVNSADRPAHSGEVGVLKTSSVTNGIFDPLENKAVIQEDVSRVKTSVIGNRIIMSRMNTPALVGANAYVKETDSNRYLPDRLWRLEPNGDTISMHWLSFVLGSKQFRQRLCDMATGTSNSMKNISKEDVLNLEVLCPPLPEQRRIAEVLGTWDEAIEKLERLIQKQKLVNNYFKQKIFLNSSFEFRSIDQLASLIFLERGRPLTANDVGIGKIPVIAGGQTVPYYHDQYTHNKPSVTISASGAYAGYVWFHSEKVWASDCNVLTSEVFNVKFIFYALEVQQSRIYRLQKGGAQPHVYPSDLGKIKIPCPPRGVQDKIVCQLDHCERKIEIMKGIVTALQRQKRGLMQKLLTGNWRV